MLAAILTFSFSLFLSLFIMSKGHFHEDAYILFIYAENLAEGHGISYYQGGPPAEGATDFLWMLLLAFLKLFGVATGISAALLNSVGLGLSAFTLSKAFLKFHRPSIKLYVFSSIFVVLVILLSPLASASFAGFSTGFYTAFISLSLYVMVLKKSYICLLPFLCLALALIRPDGLILGAGFTIIGAFSVKTKLLVWKHYLRNTLVCLALGFIYFIWRFNYFGYVLPLPLYVKSSSSYILAGLHTNLFWLHYNLELIAIFLVLCLIYFRQNAKSILLLVPSFALMVALSFATQSQNVAFRFQSPFFISILFSITLGLSQMWSSKRSFFKVQLKYIILALLVPLALLQAYKYLDQSNRIMTVLINDDYINYFPYHLRPISKAGSKIALTEAGRFSYWLKGIKFDLVGLNTPHTALFGASKEYLEQHKPDLIFIHTANTLTMQHCNTEHFCKINLDFIKEHINSSLYKDYKAWSNIKYGVYRAPLVVYDYLAEYPHEYTLALVRYGQSYNHIYAIRHAGPFDLNEFFTALDLSFSEAGRKSYLQMTRNE